MPNFRSNQLIIYELCDFKPSNFRLAGNRLQIDVFAAIVSKDVARRPIVKAGASVPSYSRGLAACIVVSYLDFL